METKEKCCAGGVCPCCPCCICVCTKNLSPEAKQKLREQLK